MRRRHIQVGLVAIAVGCAWFGRLAWRAHNDLVTLSARNAPLAEVVKSLERQTWERIRFDKTINAKITLKVKDAPLSSVLDMVAERAGARWQKTFAVAASDAAMKTLEPVLGGEIKLNAAGWTNVAPRFPDIENRDAGSGSNEIELKSSLDAPNGGEVADGGPGQAEGRPARVIRKFVRGESGPGAVGQRGRKSSDGAPGGITMITLTSGGERDEWSSERLVVESGLIAALGQVLPSEATAETAAGVAVAVHGRSRLYYNIEKAPFEMGGPSPPVARGHKSVPQGGPPSGDIAANMMQSRRQQRLRELSRSPEQQVERARQNAGSKTRIEVNEDRN